MPSTLLILSSMGPLSVWNNLSRDWKEIHQLTTSSVYNSEVGNEQTLSYNFSNFQFWMLECFGNKKSTNKCYKTNIWIKCYNIFSCPTVKLIYCIALHFGGAKLWRIWRIAFLSPKFSKLCMMIHLILVSPKFNTSKFLCRLIRHSLAPPKFSAIWYCAYPVTPVLNTLCL